MSPIAIPLLLLVAFSSTALAVPLFIRLAVARGWVDRPDFERKMHKRPTPTVGGLAIALGFCVAVGLAFTTASQFLPELTLPRTSAILGALLMIAVGFYDDTKGLDFKAKFAFQIVAAYMLLVAGYRIDISAFTGGDAFHQALYSIPLTVVWVVGIINAVNLIDGLDGLAAGISAIAMTAFAVIFGVGGNMTLMVLSLIVVGALLGFLVFNFNPASIFMGDSGSLFLGYMLAFLSIADKASSDPLLALIIPVVALGLPVVDTGMSIIRRVAEGRNICAPDRDHIHHRMTSRFAQRGAVLGLYGAGLWFGFCAIMMSILPAAFAYTLLLATALFAVAGLSVLGYFRRPATAEVEVHPSAGLSGDGLRLSTDAGIGDGHSKGNGAVLLAEVLPLRPTVGSDSGVYQSAPRPLLSEISLTPVAGRRNSGRSEQAGGHREEDVHEATVLLANELTLRAVGGR